MTVVLPTGEVTTFGSAVSKTSSGYNLLQLLIGSEGTLGVITELTLKLLPAPAAVVSLVVPFGDLAACISTVPKLRQGGLNPQAIEFFEKEILRTSEAYLEKQVFPRVIAGEEVGAYLLITFDGESEDALEPVLEKAADLLLDQGALDVLVADTPAKLKEAWAARSSFLEGIEEQTKLLDECDVVVPVTRIPEYVLFAHQLAGQYDFRLQYFGHAGDGNLHIYTCSNDMDREEFLRQVDAFHDPALRQDHGPGGADLRGARHWPGEGEVPGPGGGRDQPGPDAGDQAGLRPQGHPEPREGVLGRVRGAGTRSPLRRRGGISSPHPLDKAPGLPYNKPKPQGKGGCPMKTRVRELRTAAKLTQQKLADLVHVSSRTIISIEMEQYSPSLMLAYRLAQVFGVTVEDLCCLAENKAREDQAYAEKHP